MTRVIGAGAAVFGGLVLLYVYAHANLINPSLDEHERRAVLVETLFLQSGVCEATYLGVGMVAAGLWLAVSRPGRSHTGSPS
jgi:hypothetical protein